MDSDSRGLASGRAPGANRPRVGVWLAGARGDIAATVVAGARAIARGLTGTTGLVTELPALAGLDLCPLGDLHFGGLDIAPGSMSERVRRLERDSRTLAPGLSESLDPDLVAIDASVATLPELDWDPGEPSAGSAPLAETVARLRELLRDFRTHHALESLVVVNLISAGPSPAESQLHESLGGLDAILSDDRKDLFSPSACYAYAALAEGCAYINFTPNPGTDWPGIAELAARMGCPYAGDDGKTGETLVKTVLAPLFAHRNLRVLSWEGINLLGNADGRALAVPRNRAAKIRHKEAVLGGILGYSPHAGVDIRYVPSLGDWKTAWDLIHFTGFLEVPMTMQFTWQGCDSILAAPLVLDLVRLADLALRRGESGSMSHLACFFKRPLGTTEMDFHRQFEVLLDYAERSRAPAADPHM